MGLKTFHCQLNQGKERLSIRMEQKVYLREQNNFFAMFSGGVKMRIAICDRDKSFLANIKRLIYNYAEANKIEIVAECFVSCNKILEHTARYSMVLLGDRLLDMSGIDAAKQIRQLDADSYIVFISDGLDFVLDAFKVDAYRFLRKSTLEDELYDMLNDFFKSFGSDFPIWIKSGGDTVLLHCNEIYFLEADNKHCKLHLKDKIILCNKTMAKVYEILPKNRFCKTNRAYIVNFIHIRRYNNDYIEMKNGTILHPSRKYYKYFKEEFHRFFNHYEL